MWKIIYHHGTKEYEFSSSHEEILVPHSGLSRFLAEKFPQQYSYMYFRAKMSRQLGTMEEVDLGVHG